MRIVTGLLFLEHGLNKIIGFPAMAGAAPQAFNLMAFPVGPAGVIETVGGILIILGLFSRYAAFIASGEMAVAYFMVHAHTNFFPVVNKGELAVLYCFVFLYLAAAGGGPWSIDRLRHRG